jgi:hypothetical protein
MLAKLRASLLPIDEGLHVEAALRWRDDQANVAQLAVGVEDGFASFGCERPPDVGLVLS